MYGRARRYRETTTAQLDEKIPCLVSELTMIDREGGGMFCRQTRAVELWLEQPGAPPILITGTIELHAA